MQTSASPPERPEPRTQAWEVAGAKGVGIAFPRARRGFAQGQVSEFRPAQRDTGAQLQRFNSLCLWQPSAQDDASVGHARVAGTDLSLQHRVTTTAVGPLVAAQAWAVGACHRNRARRFWQQPLHRSRTPLPQKQSPEASEMPGRAVHTSAEDGGSTKTSASCCCACTRTVLCIFFSMLGIVRAAAMLAHRSAERRPAMARAQGSRPNPVYRGGAAAETLARFGLADTCGAGLVRGGLLPDTTRALRRN